MSAGAVVTVKVAEQVLVVSQVLVTEKVTVVAPPQLFGAPVLLLVNTGLHPPDVVTVPSHVANLLLMAVCV